MERTTNTFEMDHKKHYMDAGYPPVAAEELAYIDAARINLLNDPTLSVADREERLKGLRLRRKDYLERLQASRTEANNGRVKTPIGETS